MTQAASVPIERYDGNDVATSFAFNHYIKTTDELVLTHKTTAGVVTTPILDTDYTVAIAADTGYATITFPKVGSSYSTLASGSPAERLTALRVTDQDRPVNITGAFQFSTLNDDGDKLVRLVQELAEKISRAVLKTVSNTDVMLTYEELLVLTGAATIASLDAKAVLVAADQIMIADSADSDVHKRATLTNLVTYLNSVVEHGNLQGLSDDDHSIYALLAGRSGGQTLKGGTLATQDLTLMDNAIDGNIITVTQMRGAKKGKIILEIKGASGGAIVPGILDTAWLAPCAGTLTKVTMVADQTGSIVIDIWGTDYTNYDAGATHPVNGDTITAGAEPTISAGVKSQDATLTGWTKSFLEDTVLWFNVDSAASITSLVMKIDYDITGV